MYMTDLGRRFVVISAAIVGLFTVWYFFLSAGDRVDAMMGSVPSQKYKFETVKGFFWQDDPETDSKSFEYDTTNFGLIDRKYDSDRSNDQGQTQWQRFEQYVNHLQKSSPAGTMYKVFYNGRHGEGYHNVAEAKYGTEAWNDYWSKLDGDGELYWLDAHLTQEGKHQAQHDDAFLKNQFDEAKMPAPESYYSSPMYRCLQTANLTYSGLDLPADRPFKPLIKEFMREVMGVHTCDKRSSRSVIHNAIPEWDIESGFVEEDVLWKPDHRETHEEHDARTQELLEDIFAHDEHTFLSFTSHSGAIASLLRVIGHREFRLPTGAMIPLFIKATKVD